MKGAAYLAPVDHAFDGNIDAVRRAGLSHGGDASQKGAFSPAGHANGHLGYRTHGARVVGIGRAIDPEMRVAIDVAGQHRLAREVQFSMSVGRRNSANCRNQSILDQYVLDSQRFSISIDQ